MRKIIFIALFSLLFSGCIPAQFEIATSEVDKFADKSQKSIYTKNNRLSTKSTCDGTHLNEMGLYVNTTITTKDSKSTVFLDVMYHTWAPGGMSVCTFRSFGAIIEIIFIADDKRIAVNLETTKSDVKYYGWNSISKSFDGDLIEMSYGKISLSDLESIANSNTLAVKVIGINDSQTYEDNEIEKTFRSNLRTFLLRAKEQIN